MPDQQLNEFFLEGSSAMVFSLVLDVRRNVGDVGFADGESTVAVLPCESLQVWKLRMNPRR